MEITSDDIELLCKINEERFYFDTLLNTDNILSLEDAEEKLKRIEKEKKAVEKAKISPNKKKEFNIFFEKGESIMRDKIEQFKKLPNEYREKF